MSYYVEQLKRVTLERTSLGAAVVVTGVAAIGLANAIFAITTTDETDSPWVGHRWEPVALASLLALALSGAVLFIPRRSLAPVTRIVMVGIATVALAASAVEWHDRATGTKAQFLDAYRTLDFGPTATAAPMVYVPGRDAGFDTLASPRAKEQWQVTTPIASACPVLAQAATAWAGGLNEGYISSPTDNSPCYFEVRRGKFDTMFQYQDGSPNGPWTLTALMLQVGT